MRRFLRNGSASLAYQLYTSAALDEIWGDGTGGTGLVSDSYTLGAGRSQTTTYRLYGSIPPRPARGGRFLHRPDPRHFAALS